MHRLTKILPRLRPGVLVHFHDIFYPFEYPEQWALAENRSWNEIYCLHAFLQGNADWEIVFFNDFMARAHPAEMAALMPGFMKRPGGSLWLRRQARHRAFRTAQANRARRRWRTMQRRGR